MTLLADVGLEFGMTKRSLRIMEEIMPQVGIITIYPAMRLIRLCVGLSVGDQRR